MTSYNSEQRSYETARAKSRGGCYSQPMNFMFLEDIVPGESFEFGQTVVTAPDIVAFAKQFDPQPFHLDEVAAKASPFGGLVASGWHTAAMTMRMMVDAMFKPGSGSIGSPGIDELRWLKPVRPGDTLRVKGKVLEATPSRSKPDRGTAKMHYEVFNQKDEKVMSFIGLSMFLRRPGTGA